MLEKFYGRIFRENGFVLDTIYDKTCLQTDVGKTVIPGSIWAEKVCGTNGLGLSVELKKPTIVSGKEHFFKRMKIYLVSQVQ
ncbi:MAG: hypothetical protein CM1200mP13_13130 [Candidatus Pelagibacterales bacterium]|nr:MAG: hypothetical protein CM1200mP13_13130 [Pelagibacterales bacterium]